MFKTEGNRRGLSRELSRDELVYSIDQYNLINGRMKPR